MGKLFLLSFGTIKPVNTSTKLSTLKTGDGQLIYYNLSDTRMHEVPTMIEQLFDYCFYTPENSFRSLASVQTINMLVDTNTGLYQYS